MKRQLSLKMRLTLSVTAVLTAVMVGLGAVFLSLIGDIDGRLSGTIQDRALANARAVSEQIGFEAMVGETEPASEKLVAFRESHQEVHAVAVLVPQKEEGGDGAEGELELFVADGAELDYRSLVGLVEDREAGGVAVDGALVVAVTPAMADETQVAGYVVYTESLEEYRAFKADLQLLAVAVMIGGLVLVVLAVTFIGSLTARPINRLVETAARLANGDLRDVKVDVSGSAETQRLGKSVQEMAEALRSQVAGIKTLTSQVSSVSREVAQAMAHLASSASEQAAAVAETASTVEEMEKAGKSAAGNATQIVGASEKTTEASIRGRGAVDTTSQIILKIKQDSQDISSKSKNLLSNVEEIGNIISSVNAIAEQSKILAVNASIEAAKAGEYGMGFAVVAQEVKDLAQQSKEATLQITGTLTAIRQAIENMVGTSAGGERRTEEGVKMVANAGAIVNDLSEAIRENSEFANVIATAVNQQTLGLTQIASAIDQINVSALENQEISRKIEGGVRQMSESMDELTELVGRWKVPDAAPGEERAASAENAPTTD